MLFLEEYCALRKPLADSLDKLQGEKQAYQGHVAPTLIVLRKLLIQSTQLKFCKPLCLALINSLEKRFDCIFNLSDTNSKDYIIASISHPKFKLSWVPVRYTNLCKTIFINDCNAVSIVDENKISGSTDEDDDNSSDGFYDNLFQHCDKSDTTLHSTTYTQESDSIDVNTARISNAASAQALTFLN